MKINELLMSINNKEFNLVEFLEIKKYLPIEVKKTIAQGIIYECSTFENGVIKIDSVQRYLSYVRYMITMHTNLEYTDEDYDILCSTECGGDTLFNAIMNSFDNDAKECYKIVDFVINDYLYENSIEFTINRFLNNLSEHIGDLATKITNKVDSMDINSMIPDGVDMEKLSAFLSTYIK